MVRKLDTLLLGIASSLALAGCGPQGYDKKPLEIVSESKVAPGAIYFLDELGGNNYDATGALRGVENDEVVRFSNQTFYSNRRPFLNEPICFKYRLRSDGQAVIDGIVSQELSHTCAGKTLGDWAE